MQFSEKLRRIVSSRISLGVFAAVLLFPCPVASGQHFHHASAGQAADRISPCRDLQPPTEPRADLQQVEWNVTASGPDANVAQLYFRQGMTEYYAFNYEEALRYFRKARNLDPGMAMASWGIAMAAGPNVNIAQGGVCYEVAFDASREAHDRRNTGTAVEQDLIDAVYRRYREAGKNVEIAAKVYAKYMEIAWEYARSQRESRRDDIANVGALYAESLLELEPWNWFTVDGKPAPSVEKAIAALAEAMGPNGDRNGVGANHFWIHAIEEGPHPGDARRSANLLNTFVPAAAHLVHMPSHIFLLLGNYYAAVDSNVRASAADELEYKDACAGDYDTYSKAKNRCPALYYGHYLTHNLFFGAVSATFSGQSSLALEMARATRKHVERFMSNEPGLQRYMTAPLMTMVMNRDWAAIKDETDPPAACYISNQFPSTGCHILKSVFHWAKGMREASLPNLNEADKEYAAMKQEMKEAAGDGWGNNNAPAVLAIADLTLQARIDWANTSPNDHCTSAIQKLKEAVVAEDHLTYDEPPQWFPPAREALGGAFLQRHQWADAAEIFKAELDRHPKSGRALYGRMLALVKLGGEANKIEAQLVADQFYDAWELADYTMTEDALWPSSDRCSAR